MILVRTVFNVKQGNITRAVDEFKKMLGEMPGRPVLLTDLSGPFNTVVLEARYDSLAAYEKARAEMFSRPDMQEAQSQNEEQLFESGSNEFYTIELG